MKGNDNTPREEEKMYCGVIISMTGANYSESRICYYDKRDFDSYSINFIRGETEQGFVGAFWFKHPIKESELNKIVEGIIENE